MEPANPVDSLSATQSLPVLTTTSEGDGYFLIGEHSLGNTKFSLSITVVSAESLQPFVKKTGNGRSLNFQFDLLDVNIPTSSFGLDQEIKSESVVATIFSNMAAMRQYMTASKLVIKLCQKGAVLGSAGLNLGLVIPENDLEKKMFLQVTLELIPENAGLGITELPKIGVRIIMEKESVRDSIQKAQEGRISVNKPKAEDSLKKSKDDRDNVRKAKEVGDNMKKSNEERDSVRNSKGVGDSVKMSKEVGVSVRKAKEVGDHVKTSNEERDSVRSSKWEGDSVRNAKELGDGVKKSKEGDILMNSKEMGDSVMNSKELGHSERNSKKVEDSVKKSEEEVDSVRMSTDRISRRDSGKKSMQDVSERKFKERDTMNKFGVRYGVIKPMDEVTDEDSVKQTFKTDMNMSETISKQFASPTELFSSYPEGFLRHEDVENRENQVVGSEKEVEKYSYEFDELVVGLKFDTFEEASSYIKTWSDSNKLPLVVRDSCKGNGMKTGRLLYECPHRSKRKYKTQGHSLRERQSVNFTACKSRVNIYQFKKTYFKVTLCFKEHDGHLTGDCVYGAYPKVRVMTEKTQEKLIKLEEVGASRRRVADVIGEETGILKVKLL